MKSSFRARVPNARAAQTSTSPLDSGRSRLVGATLLSLTLAIGVGACSKDKKVSASDVAASAESTASSLVDAAVSEAKSAASEAKRAISDSTVVGAEGPAKGYALQMKTTLEAMSGGGEPTVANFQEAAKALPATAKMTGLDDSDGNGKDDDAKVTIESGSDKACLRSQNAKWEVTDNEC